MDAITLQAFMATLCFRTPVVIADVQSGIHLFETNEFTGLYWLSGGADTISKRYVVEAFTVDDGRLVVWVEEAKDEQGAV